MNTNLDKIALDLYGKIETRFPDIKIGDENATVLSKKTDIPKARFFEFEYKDQGRSLGTITITLDEDDGVVVQISGDLTDSQHHSAFKFIRSFRQFAKDRLLNFDVQNIGKSELDKRDYEFQAKPKEQPMEPMMESKLYGTAKMSYQDLGEAKLIVKHSQPINPELAAGRTMHIESIYVENADGERFKYPFKHLNGARALAEHIKAGGNPYDTIGKHITSLSEELAQLRKFKNYVGRNDTLSEAMDDVNQQVMERIDQVKKEVQSLQRPAYYQAFAESFEANESQEIPEEILNDWIDRLTIRTFNEELKTAFPYIYRLVGENIPVKVMNPDDLLDEVFDGDKETGTTHKGGKVTKTDKGIKHEKTDYEDGNGEKGRKPTDAGPKNRYHKTPVLDPEEQFESFMNKLVAEDEETQEGENTLFSPNKSTQQSAIDKFNEIMKTELKGGPEGINVIDSLKGLIDDPEFLDKMKNIDPDLDARGTIQSELNTMAQQDPEIARILTQLDFKGDGQIGGETPPPEASAPTPGAAAPPPAAPPAGPEATPPGAPPAGPETTPPAPPPIAEGEDEEPPFDGPYTKTKGDVKDKSGAVHTGHSRAKHLAKSGMIKAIHNAKKAGAKLDTTLDFGSKEMTLHDCIRECGMSASDFGFDHDEGLSGTDEILRSIAGFWNKEEKNFTIGGTRAKTIVVKNFKNGEYKNAGEEDLNYILKLIDKADPSEHTSELGHIKHLSGMQPHAHEVDIEVGEGTEQDDFSKMMAQFQQMHPQADVGKMLQQIQNDPNAKITRTNTSSGSIDGKPANYDDAMSKFRGMAGKMGFDASGDDPTDSMMKGIQGKMGGMMGKMPQGQQMPGGMGNPQDMMKGMMGKFGMQESDELSNILKIAGVKK